MVKVTRNGVWLQCYCRSSCLCGNTFVMASWMLWSNICDCSKRCLYVCDCYWGYLDSSGAHFINETYFVIFRYMHNMLFGLRDIRLKRSLSVMIFIFLTFLFLLFLQTTSRWELISTTTQPLYLVRFLWLKNQNKNIHRFAFLHVVLRS